jgi:hypothetical protein
MSRPFWGMGALASEVGEFESACGVETWPAAMTRAQTKPVTGSLPLPLDQPKLVQHLTVSPEGAKIVTLPD